MDTQEEKLKEEEEARDFFCIVNDLFRIFARRSSMLLGSAWAFTLAMIIILVWGLSGPTFHFSETWQLNHQYGNYHHLPDGFPDSEYAESRLQGR